MNRKIKKLFRDPKLFFHDMFEKRNIARNKREIITKARTAKTENTIASTKFSYEIVVIANETVTDLERCIQSINNQRLVSFNKINVSVIDLGLNDIQCGFLKNYLEESDGDLKFYSADDMLSYCSFVESLRNHYTVFLWGNDFLDVNFMQVTDKFISTDPKKLKRGSIICTSVLKANSMHEIGRNFNALTALFSKLPEVNVPPDKTVVDSVYGAFFPTGVLKVFLRREGGFGCFDFDGLGIYIDIFQSLPNTRRICISTKSKYLVHENNISMPFKAGDWSNEVLYQESFVNFVDRFNYALPRAKTWSVFLRRTLYYFLLKYVKRGLTNQSLLDFLSTESRERFIEYFKVALSLVGADVIGKFNVSCTEQLKVGCLNLIGSQRFNGVVELLQYNESKKMSLFRYYSSKIHAEYFIEGKKDICPSIEKNVTHYLFGREFFLERKVWLRLNQFNNNDSLSIRVDRKPVKIRGLNNKVVDKISFREIVKQHAILKPKFRVNAKYKNCWIFMDRDNQADDNAEHLYRYCQKVRPDIDSYFVLLNDSHDWERLEREGFRLLAFGSAEHELALESCSRVISSHAAQFATDYFKDKRMTWKKFIFLQHGIIHNDQSTLFRPDWKKFDLFVTSASDEYRSIAGDFGTYKFTANEVAFTGLPRHDALVNSTICSEKIILVMPTWRPSLLGKVISGTTRELLSDFTESEYAQKWYDFLANDKLKKISEDNGYRIIFFPHANIQPYLDRYMLPEHVTVLSHSSGSIQELFLKASLMVTDYSSVAFEVAYLNKPVCYYQFDEEDFFNKGHYNKGYFSYRENGFGPVFNEEMQAVNFVISTIQNGCKLENYYQEKVDLFFPYRDGKCCERTLDAIEALDTSNIETHVLEQAGFLTGKRKVAEWAKQTYHFGDMVFAKRRYDSIFSVACGDDRFLDIEPEYIVNYIDILISLGYFDLAQDVMSSCESLSYSDRKYFELKLKIYESIVDEDYIDFSDIEDHNLNILYYKKLFFDSSYEMSISNPLNEEDKYLFDNFVSEPGVTAKFINEHKDYFNSSMFHSDFIRLRVLEISERFEYIIKIFPLLPSCDKENILIKTIYLRALLKLNKWALISRCIGNSSILQGRTGISLFACCYLFSLRALRKKAIRVDDFLFLSDEPELLKEDYRLNIVKYYLYIETNLDIVKVFIDAYWEDLPLRIIEDFLYKLCENNLSDQAYSYFRTVCLSELSIKSLSLYGELAMSYGEYDVAVDVFQQACLSRLPVVDNKLRQKLYTARLWKNESTQHVIRYVI